YQVKPPLPFTPGAEVAGVVDEIGAGVDGIRVGDRVLAIPNFGPGGFAESTTAGASGGVFPIPESMSFAAGSALHVVYQTGHLALHRRAHLQAGETLLVHAGAGGVGSAAIQLGLAAGARVVATAGGPGKVEVCRKLGAHLALETHDEQQRHIEAGKIDPLISEHVSLAEVPAALARLGSRGTYGKVVCEL